MTSPSPPLPRMLPDLRLALACLYNLPYPQQHQTITLQQAQEFLIYLQSRNTRRKVQSLLQRQRDKSNKLQGAPNNYTTNVSAIDIWDINNSSASGGGVDPITAGSSWLACLTLLCQQQEQRHASGVVLSFAASNTERLFAAQTLLHRLLKTKLDQGIDLEIEVIHDNAASGENLVAQLCQQLQHPLPLSQLMQQYQHWMHILHFHPLIGQVISQYNINTAEVEEEDRVKGELTVLTLTAVMYLTATASSQSSTNHHNGHDHDHNTGPLLNALGSAVAAAALRLRYPPTTPNGQQKQAPPLVTLVTQALTLVIQTASASGANNNLQASSDCLRACLAAIPDIALGAGGARGRMSIDPKSLQEAASELKTMGVGLLWEVLQNHVQDMQQQQQQQYETKIHENILIICERWARFLPLPLEFLQHTVPLASQYISWTQQDSSSGRKGIRKAALSYLVAIYEGGTWTPEQILTKSLGLSPEQQQQSNQAKKKRQTSKSKKRQQEILTERSTESMIEEAKAEFFHRGAMACHTTVMVWDALQTAFRASLCEHNASAQADADIQIEGEGPIGCLAACSNACLPHLLRNSSSAAQQFPQSKELFGAISKAFQEMCSSKNRVIRAFSMEPLYSLHTAMIQHILEHQGHRQQQALDPELQKLLVDHFFQSSMSLATSCGYPADYFHHMGAESDEDLEMERNDVRDVLRTVAVSEDGGSTAFADCSRPPLEVTLQILARLLHTCAEAVQSAQKGNQLFPETAVHCFSALAKPLNQLSKCYVKSGQPGGAVDILRAALQNLGACLQIVIDAFPVFPLSELLPASRVVDLSIASLSPMISNLCNIPGLKEDVEKVVQLSLRSAAVSVAHIPELATPSTLGFSMYDIRGAMRGPGGEDHVGCLAIMRLAFESDNLARTMVQAAGSDVQQLCQLHSQLKSIEISREKGVDHGQGVTPKSRRILLGIICHLEIVTEGAAGCASMLTDLFNSAVAAIAAYNTVDSSSFSDENVIYQMCENTWDLTAFSPVIVATLFNGEGGELAAQRLDCIRALTTCICNGYKRLSIHHEPSPVDFQWNRLRAAFFTLLRKGASSDLPHVAIEVVEAITRSECEAIHMQCQAGPTSSSSIFHEGVVSDETIPAGLFVRVIGEIIERVGSKSGNADACKSCLQALHKTRTFVLSTIALPCTDPEKFSDPRPALAEAFILTMNELVKIEAANPESTGPTVRELLIETCATSVAFLFHPALGKTRDERSSSPLMSLEGPQTLALLEYLSSCFGLGLGMLQQVAEELRRRIPIDSEKANVYSADLGCQNVAIIGASLFRAASGGLPPWAVESVPSIYSSLFFALNKDVNAFGQILQLSLEIRLAQSANGFGSVQPGQLLSGPLFEGVTDTSKQTFLVQAMEQCKKDDISGWKRLKALVKGVSGGKKKDTDFRQKPSPTKWDFDRM
jgi:hypothetical protein